MKITFFKSDAMADLYPDEPLNLELEAPHNIQLTNGVLRTTRNWPELGLREGDDLAYISDEDWVTESGKYPNPLLHWSDVIIGDET